MQSFKVATQSLHAYSIKQTIRSVSALSGPMAGCGAHTGAAVFLPRRLSHAVLPDQCPLPGVVSCCPHKAGRALVLLSDGSVCAQLSASAAWCLSTAPSVPEAITEAEKL